MSQPTTNSSSTNGGSVQLSSGLTMLPPRSSSTTATRPTDIMTRSDSIPTRMVENVTLQDANGNNGVYNGPVILEQPEDNNDNIMMMMPPVSPMDDPDAPPPPLTDISLDDDKPLVPHGKYGQMVYMDHDHFLKYTGDWDQGHWTKGTCLYANGNVYSGNFNRLGQPHGTNGKLEWVVESRAAPGSSSNTGGEDTREYQGDFDNGTRHGQGVYTWSKSGAMYQGAFVKNQRQGYGTYRDPSTNIEYVGEWKQGVYHGYGQYTWRDSHGQKLVYRGGFHQGKPQGQGVQVNENGDVMHDGEWFNGKPVPGTSKSSQVSPTTANNNNNNNNNNSTATQQSQPPPPVATATPSPPQRQAPPPPQQQNRAAAAPRAPTTAASSSSSRTTVTRVAPSGSNSISSTPGAPSKGTVTVVHDREWMDTVNQTKPQLGIYRGLWLAQNPYQNGTVAYEGGEVDSYEGWFNLQGYYHGQECRLNFRNGDCYIGDFEYGQRHGKGWYTWKDGRQYKGQFVKNSREGKGTLIYPNSDFYEGHFVQGKRHGHGRFIFANGSMYEGHWIAGQYHGNGTLVQSDGSTYIGSFERGVKHGKGKDLNQAGKLVYEGNYWRGKAGDGPPPASAERATSDASNQSSGSNEAAPQTAAAKLQQYQAQPTQETTGQGKTSSPVVESYWVPDDDEDRRGTGVAPVAPPLRAPPSVMSEEPPCEAVVDQEITDCQGNPGRFTGLVLVSTKRPHGVGRLVYQDGKRIHEGFWRNGSKEGHGRCLFFPQGDFHEGEYQNNLRNGPGRYQWKDGRLFIGAYKDDLRHGKGVFTYPSGDRYEGMFSKGQRSGFGRFRFSGGQYEGEWHAGKYHGRGRLIWGHGSEYEGDFAQGTFHGAGVLRNESGHVLEKGRWFKGKRVSSDSTPTAPPPAAAPPPLPPQPPVTETPMPTAKSNPPSEGGEQDESEDAPVPQTPLQQDAERTGNENGASAPTDEPASEYENKRGSSTPVTVESYAVDDEDAADVVPMSSPPPEDFHGDEEEVEGEVEKEEALPATAVAL